MLELISGVNSISDINALRLFLVFIVSIIIGKFIGEKRHIGVLKTFIISFYTILCVPLPLFFIAIIIINSPSVNKPKPKASNVKLGVSITFLIIGLIIVMALFSKKELNEIDYTNLKSGITSIFFSVYGIINYYNLKKNQKI
jgi:hypothetical protein